jgi:capsular polysaccharide biosynthesis protein
MATIVSDWREVFPNENQNKTFPGTVEVDMPSLDRLLQLAASDGTSSIVCPTNKTTLQCDKDSSTPTSLHDEVLYVNCAATQSDNDAFATAPLSLLQCRDLLLSEMGVINDDDGEKVVTIIPRNDLFLTSPTFPTTTTATLTLPSLAPLGTMHFHTRPDPNTTAVKQNIPNEIQWFTNRIIAHHKVPYYAVLGKTLADAYGCVLASSTNPASGESMYRCPTKSDPTRSIWTAPKSIWNIVRPVMYQWPQPYSRREQGSSTVDPVTPAVAVFRHTFCEMGTGRLLLHIPQRPSYNCSCHTTTNEAIAVVTRHRQVLMQLNQCNDPKAFASSASNKKPYEPFQLRVPSTTLAHKAGAYRYYDSAIVITATWSVEYYHTVVEHLPRLLLLRDFILALPDQSIPIVVSQSYKKKTFLKFFADIWGLGHRLVFVKADFVVYADAMYVPEPTTCLALHPIMAQAHRNAIRNVLRQRQPVSTNQSQFRPELINTVNATETSTSMLRSVTDNNEDDLDTATDWIVVVRRNRTRFLRNHDEMMAALTSALPHEKWYVFDEGNTDGKFPAPGIPQWAVFARAKLVIAPHGAGLANLLACPKNIDVVEMLGEGKDSELCFLHLALALGLRYHPVHMINPYKGWNYEADIEQVVHVVKSIVQSKRTRTDLQSHISSMT